ncbi:MAG TPA: diphthine synthase [Methanomassiliicoccales archaeon]|nr:diphthine synthase [Methanomassiliicoccales archaeon]
MGELIFVGLGLGGTDDLSTRAVNALKGCDQVFGEFYTSKLIDSTPDELESLIGKKIVRLSRREVEEEEIVIEASKKGKVAFITAGDTMAATTHVDLKIRAMEDGIKTTIIYGISIFTACSSALGLQPYKFGRTVTIPFQEPGYTPLSPYENIFDNWSRGLHTLVLLDIREEEERYMTANQAVEWLLAAEKAVGKGMITDKQIICAAARVGSQTEKVAANYPQVMLNEDMGPPLHAVVVPGKLHFVEAYALVKFAGAPDEIAEDQNL